MPGQFVHQPLTEVTGNGRNTAGVLVLQCGLAVLVCASERGRCQNVLRVTVEVGVVDDMLTVMGIDKVDKLFVLAQSLLVLVLLNDNQVAASLRVGILLKEIVGQAEGGHVNARTNDFRNGSRVRMSVRF